MMKLVTKQGCCRCYALKSMLCDEAKKQVIEIRGTKCCGYVGLGDVVEAVIHTLQLHKLWALLHGKPTNWVCPGCQRRKNWLNELWYFGSKDTKAVWKAVVDSKHLKADAQYPFLMVEIYGVGPVFYELNAADIANPGWVSKALEP